jgi:hypothetical protein
MVVSEIMSASSCRQNRPRQYPPAPQTCLLNGAQRARRQRIGNGKYRIRRIIL